MKRALFAVLIVFATASMVSAQDAAKPLDIKGNWNMNIETPQGARPVALKFTEVAGENFKGTFDGPQGPLEIAGTLKGSAIQFEANIETPNGSLTLSFEGKIENEKMSGTVAFGSFGSGAWTAERAKG
jgi:hypothetical protein